MHVRWVRGHRLAGKGDPTFASTMVLDQIDGRWLAVALGSQQCRQAPAEVWQVFSLRPEAEGTFTGEYRSRSAMPARISER